MAENNSKPFLGFGLGLRTEHYQDVLNDKPENIDWFEIITENYLVDGGKPLDFLDKVRAHYPIVMHGVSLSVGSSDPLNWDYIRQVKNLADRVDAKWFSDHLCWTGLNATNVHDLLPLPYTDETIKHVAQRISEVQDFVGRRMLIENVSSYLTYKASAMHEWQFLNHVVDEADCGILLDVNNIYVSSFNHEFDPREYLDAINTERVYQIHLAGHLNTGDYIVDTHDHPVIDAVWELYEYAINRFGAVSTMIERDDNIPPLMEVLEELDHARALAEPILERQAA
ncbi:MAG: hypothetical protein ACI8P9_002999 [Parasphingorhabdus sp.]|jgi:uncharacterized protein (UPF0276 family)